MRNNIATQPAVTPEVRPVQVVAELRALRGRPLPTEYSLRVSGLRWNTEDGYHVHISGDGRAIFCARLALCHVKHDWLDTHGLLLHIDRLVGADYRASAEAAREYYETFEYRPEDDIENIRIVTIPAGDTRYYGRE